MPDDSRQEAPRERDSRWSGLAVFEAIPAFAKGPSAITLATTIAAQGLLVVSGIIVARALGVDGRGTLALLWLMPLALALLGGIGIPQATTYYVARNATNAAAIVRISVRVTAGLAAFLVMAYGLGLFLLGDVGGAYSAADAVLSISLIPPLLGISLGVASLLGMKRYMAFNAARVVAPLTYATGAAVLLLLGDAALTAVMVTLLMSWSLGAVASWVAVFRDLPSTGEPVSTSARDIVGFGLRGVVGSTSIIDDVRVDQLLVGLMMDARGLGLYVAAAAFTNLPRFVGQSIGSVAFPRIASAESTHAAWAATDRAARIGVVAIAATVATLLATIGFLLPFLFGDDFSDAVGIGRILIAAAFFLALQGLLAQLARGLGHPGYGSITEVVNGSVFLVGVLVLATPATTTGIAGAVLAGGVSSSLLLSLLLLRLRHRSGRDPGAPVQARE